KTMTDQQQLYEVEAEIAAIQPEIAIAKEKVEKAEEKLEKAIADRDPADIRADLKAILQSASAELTSLRQKEAMLMEWMLRIKEKMDDKDGGNHAGRLFEHTFRQSFIKALYNDGKGLVVSTEYYSPVKACRKYTNQTEPELMDQLID
ncbi:hypothetical protein MP638_000360, partial [Amoeboaphelidium occidentale]